MAELNIDPKAPDFNEKDMVAKFQEIADNPREHFFIRDRFAKLIDLLKEHKFWDN